MAVKALKRQDWRGDHGWKVPVAELNGRQGIETLRAAPAAGRPADEQHRVAELNGRQGIETLGGEFAQGVGGMIESQS